MVTDASFWFAIFVEADAHYTEASECLERALELQQVIQAPEWALAPEARLPSRIRRRTDTS